jgi:hypothetical protein
LAVGAGDPGTKSTSASSPGDRIAIVSEYAPDALLVHVMTYGVAAERFVCET